MAVPTDELAQHQHAVAFHESDGELAERVAEFLADGLLRGDAGLAVLTADHAEMVRAELARRGCDHRACVGQGRLVFVDAHLALAQVMTGFSPDPHRFADAMGAVVEELAMDGSHVRVVGEVVALLWERGNTAAAVELESLWDERARAGGVSVLCTYPLSPFLEVDDLMATARICDHHPEVSPPAAYPRRGPDTSVLSETSRVFLPLDVAVGAARHFVVASLDALGVDPAAVPEAALLCSELATNAVLHARSPFRVTVGRSDAGVRIAVADAHPAPPERRDPGPDVPHGRGLAMVERLAAAWGTEPSPAGGKSVWAELAMDTTA